MRKRDDSCWVDPRFRKRKDMPKAIRLGKLGQAPPPIERPTYVTARAIPSGTTCPPCPPGTKRATSSFRPTSSYSRQATAPKQQPVSTSLRTPTNPAAMAPPGLMKAPVVASPPVQRVRPSMMYRPGSGLPQRPMTVQAPVIVTASSCPPEPCPPEPCPEPCPQPGPSRVRASGLPRMQGLRPPMVGVSRLRPPSVSPATNVTVRRSRSPVQCPPEPCPPDPCPPDPCIPDTCLPCIPDPCVAASVFSGTTQSFSASASRRQPPFRSILKPPSRLMGSGYSSSAQKPQKIVILPGDIDPGETTVITVEPPQQRPHSTQLRPHTARGSGPAPELWIPRPVQMDFSPPSMASCMQNPIPSPPYIPPEIQSFLDTLPTPCPGESPSEMATPTVETSRGLLIDVSPIDPNTFEPPQVIIEPVDLMTFPANDPFSPERHLRPLSPSVSPPPIPFSPPKSPIPEPSELHKWYSQYPQYRQAFTSTSHPILEYSRLRRQRPPSPPSPQRFLGDQRTPACVDKELKARTVPFNTKLATICKDDSDEEDLGLLPDFIGEDYLTTPLDYEAIRRREEQERQELLAQRKEEERRLYGPTLAETREMLERVREAEAARRAALRPMSPCRPPPIPMEASRERYRRLMAKAERVGALEGHSEILETVPESYTMLQEMEMDDIDLDDIDFDECPDF